MGLDLSVNLGKLKLQNPVLVASGTFGYAKEFERFFDLKQLGGIVTKTLTLKPRIGNPPQRVHETPSGMLNAIGLQNVGVEVFIKDKLPYLSRLGIPLIASVMGYSVDEFVKVVEALNDHKGIDGFELNLSCPNVEYSNAHEEPMDRPAKMFAHDESMILNVVNSVRQATDKTVIAKLGPDVSDVGKMALAAQKGGADAVSLINTFIAMSLDIKTQKPVLKNITGGLSGPCIRPIAVRMVWEVARAVKIPVIGMGGIMNANDVLEFMIAGAACVQVGTANFINPTACPQILSDLKSYMKQAKINTLSKVVGTVKGVK
jgi:dihydroorotate dehydrogenase (NAD+) catalytic subunit